MSEPLHYRSGAVARMVDMPVTTLRVWERRYGVGSARVTASGHRLYDAADVERIALLKRLTHLGHAIGSIAALPTAELRRVGATHAGARALAGAAGSAGNAVGTAATPTRPARGTAARRLATAAVPRAARLVVVGAALAQRLQRLARADAPWRVVGVFDDLAQAARAGGRPASHAARARADLLLIDAPALPAQVPREVPAALRAWPGLRAGLVYGFGAEAARAAHAAAGLALLRDPRDDEALAAWVEALSRTATAASAGGPARGSAVRARGAARELSPEDLVREAAALVFEMPLGPAGAIPPRRYDDLALVELAARAPAMACECPRHVAELLKQLSHFEAYSAQCLHRNADDAEVHAHLQRVAGLARALFERALERVAVHEGLALVATAPSEPRP